MLRVSLFQITLVGLLLVACDCPLAAQPPPEKKPPSQPTKDQVIKWLHMDARPHESEIVSLGTSIFPLLDEILDDPATHSDTVVNVFFFLTFVESDRSIFLERALPFLRDENGDTRRLIVGFLKNAGGTKEAGPLTLLLLDDDSTVRLAAARAIAKIGGKAEVATFDLILSNANRYEEKGKPILRDFDIDDYKKCRDELKARLKKQDEEKAKKATPPPKKDDKK